jgi:hypothetical protein
VSRYDNATIDLMLRAAAILDEIQTLGAELGQIAPGLPDGDARMIIGFMLVNCLNLDPTINITPSMAAAMLRKQAEGKF